MTEDAILGPNQSDSGPISLGCAPCVFVPGDTMIVSKFQWLASRFAAFVVLVSMSLSGYATAQTTTAQLKIAPRDPAEDKFYGVSVAVEENTSLITARDFSESAVYFVQTDTGQQMLKLTPGDLGANGFDDGVAISNGIAIIGSALDQVGPDSPGAAYLYHVASGQHQRLIATDGEENDKFGRAVAISGNLAVVGAPEDNGVDINSGSVYVFDVTTRAQLFKLTADDAAANAYFGSSVAISGNTIVVGAPQADGVDLFSGTAYVFDATTGQQLFKLEGSDVGPDDAFGYSVAVSGDTAIIGNFLNGGSSAGSVYLFDTTTGQQIARLNESQLGHPGETFIQFGVDVAAKGDLMVTNGRVFDGTDLIGRAYLFDLNTGALIAELEAPQGADDLVFAFSVAISGTTVIAGDPYDADAGPDAGAAYLVNLDATITQQPVGVIADPHGTAQFEVQASGPVELSYQWYRSGVAMSDTGRFSGTDTPTLTITDVRQSDEVIYRCVVTGLNETSTQPVVLALRPDPNACAADLNGDGVLNFFDVSVFLSAYSAGCP